MALLHMVRQQAVMMQQLFTKDREEAEKEQVLAMVTVMMAEEALEMAGVILLLCAQLRALNAMPHFSRDLIAAGASTRQAPSLPTSTCPVDIDVSNARVRATGWN